MITMWVMVESYNGAAWFYSSTEVTVVVGGGRGRPCTTVATPSKEPIETRHNPWNIPISGRKKRMMHLGHFFQLRIEIYSSLLVSVRVIVPPNVIRFIIPINQTSLQFPESQSPLFANNSWRVQSTSKWDQPISSLSFSSGGKCL